MADKKVQRACDILQAQIEKTKEPGFRFSSWHNQTLSLIKHYFGETSNEYKTFEFVYGDGNYGIKVTENTKALAYVEHVRACIETLKIKGLVKKEAKPLLSRVSDKALLAIIALILSGYGWLIKELYYANKEITKLELRLIPASKDIPSDEPHDSTEKAHPNYDSSKIDMKK